MQRRLHSIVQWQGDLYICCQDTTSEDSEDLTCPSDVYSVYVSDSAILLVVMSFVNKMSINLIIQSESRL
jgi:hypothetical protein